MKIYTETNHPSIIQKVSPSSRKKLVTIININQAYFVMISGPIINVGNHVDIIGM